MSYLVTKENLDKVVDFFVRRVKETGSNAVQHTIIEVAEGSGVAVATAHKALKELKARGIIDVDKPKTNRIPITYIFLGEIEDFELKKKKMSQIEYLQQLVAELQEENTLLKHELLDAKGRLASYENRTSTK